MQTARALSRGWTSRSATVNSWCWSAPPDAARRPRCAWSPASSRSARGYLRIGDRVVNHMPARDRDIAMVFQSYALYPHLTVFGNIAFGLRLRKAPKAEIDLRVREAAHILGLTEFLERKPRALSGGQRQRDDPPDRRCRARCLCVRLARVSRSRLAVHHRRGVVGRPDPDGPYSYLLALQRPRPLRHDPRSRPLPHGVRSAVRDLPTPELLHRDPADLLEAARIDGASEFRIFFRVILPLGLPAIASLAIFQFLWVWNDLLVALTFARDTQPITVAIFSQMRQFSANIELIAPAAFISLAIPLVVFFLFQRYFVQGLLAGSVK